MTQVLGLTEPVRLRKPYRPNYKLVNHSCRFDPLLLFVSPSYPISSGLILLSIQEAQYFINTNYLNL